MLLLHYFLSPGRGLRICFFNDKKTKSYICGNRKGTKSEISERSRSNRSTSLPISLNTGTEELSVNK